MKVSLVYQVWKDKKLCTRQPKQPTDAKTQWINFCWKLVMMQLQLMITICTMIQLCPPLKHTENFQDMSNWIRKSMITCLEENGTRTWASFPVFITKRKCLNQKCSQETQRQSFIICETTWRNLLRLYLKVWEDHPNEKWHPNLFLGNKRKKTSTHSSNLWNKFSRNKMTTSKSTPENLNLLGANHQQLVHQLSWKMIA